MGSNDLGHKSSGERDHTTVRLQQSVMNIFDKFC